MTLRGYRAALVLALLLLCACVGEGIGDEKVRALAKGVGSAIRTADEAAFLKCHVQPEDVSPSGDYWLATKAGGERPDEAWNRQLRDAFAALQSDLKAMGVDPAALEFVDVAGGEVYRVNNDEDRQNLQNLRIRMKSGDTAYLFGFSEGMLSQRGWVLVGDPAVRIETDSGSGKTQ